MLGKALDTLCPPLQTTSRLEDKALRCVFSVGVEAVLLQAEISAMLGPLNLRTADMISSDETSKVFGTLVIPDLDDIK